jgi:hypothetical protein
MRLSKRHRWLRRLALGLAVAAVAAPSAQAITPIVAPEFPTWTVNWVERPQAAPEFPTWTVDWAQPKAPESPTATPTGFDYADAGIGAAIAFGAALLAAASFLGLRRSRRPASPA